MSPVARLEEDLNATLEREGRLAFWEDAPNPYRVGTCAFMAFERGRRLEAAGYEDESETVRCIPAFLDQD